MIDWFLRDRRTGRWVLVQVPNVPLRVWLATAVARRFWDVPTAVGVVGTVALVVWAGDEVLRGANPFRRLLGAVVLGGLVLGRVSN